MTLTGGAPTVSGLSAAKACQSDQGQGNFKWVSASFWPLILPDGVSPAQFVQEVRELPRVEGLFVEGCSGCNLFKGIPNTPVLALRLNW